MRSGQPGSTRAEHSASAARGVRSEVTVSVTATNFIALLAVASATTGRTGDRPAATTAEPAPTAMRSGFRPPPNAGQD
jgi:hypothetical protein